MLVDGTPRRPDAASSRALCYRVGAGEHRVTPAKTSLYPVNIKVCFGRTQVGLASRALVLLYLLLTSSFATSVGIVLLLRRYREAKEKSKEG